MLDRLRRDSSFAEKRQSHPARLLIVSSRWGPNAGTDACSLEALPSLSLSGVPRAMVALSRRSSEARHGTRAALSAAAARAFRVSDRTRAGLRVSSRLVGEAMA